MAAWGALLEDDDASPTTTASVLTALASASDLRVPASVLRGDGWEDSVACRRRYVEDLYAREPSILLERHGHLVPRSRLLAAFGHLEGSSYECDFHLNRLKEGATTTTGGTGTGTGTTTATARNRRLAHMRSSLEPAGYFHEDALRRREPLLFETFVGAPARADSNSNSNLNLNSTATATATDGAGASHAVSLAMLEREDERAAAALLSRQRAALRERERVEDMDAEDEPPLEDEPPPAAATDAASRPGVVVEAVGPGGRRGASGRATADQLRRAAVEGWARGNDDDDDADANRRLGGCEPSSCGTGTTREINRSAIASVVADPERDAKLAAFARTMRERYLGAFFTLHTGPHTTPFARCTPFLEDFISRRVSPPITPRFQSQSRRTVTPFNSASDAFQIHPDVASRGPSTLVRRNGPRRGLRGDRRRSVVGRLARARGDAGRGGRVLRGGRRIRRRGCRGGCRG